MGRLTLIRHGQASFLAEDYDNLSDLGRKQCRLLGEYWVAHGMRYTQFYIGPRKRHRQSAEEAASAYRDAGLPAPELVMLPALDEFAWGELMRHAKEVLPQSSEHMAALRKAFDEAPNADEKYRTVQRLVEAVTRMWVEGEIDEPHIESWPAFIERVHGAIAGITAEAAGGARIAAFTSGGTVAATMHYALHSPALKTLELIWTLRNGALTEFLFTGERFNLSCFNEAPHLPRPELWTFR